MRAISTPITLIILLGLLSAGVWWGYKSVSTRVAGSSTPCVTMAMKELATSAVTVNVFNSGSRTGLAARISDALIAGGFIKGTVSNSSNNVQTVMIIGANIDDPEVQLVAAWFVEPAIQADGRADHSVDVYVGDSYNEDTGMVADAPTSLQIPSGEVCLPASATPTPEATGEAPIEGPPAPGTDETTGTDEGTDEGTEPEEPGETEEPPIQGPPAPEPS